MVMIVTMPAIVDQALVLMKLTPRLAKIQTMMQTVTNQQTHMVTYAVIMLMKVGVGPATPILSTTMRCVAFVEVALTMMEQAL